MGAEVILGVNENPLTIGNEKAGRGNERPFFGVIDELKIYNRTLSDAEIGEAMKAAAVQPSEKLATSWGRHKSL